MDWERERYVRAYKRDTPEWVVLDWQARALFWEVLRKADIAGRLDMGKAGIRGVAALIHWPLTVVVEFLPKLLEDGCVQQNGTVLTIPNYVPAQESKASPGARQSAWRERRKIDAGASRNDAGASNADDAGASMVTTINSSNAASTHSNEASTDRNADGRPVTPSLAKPSQAKQEPNTTAPPAMPSAPDDTPAKRGARLPENWGPSPALYGWANKEFGLTAHEVDQQVVEFRDFWTAVPGQKARKLDWDATFRNRLREVARRRPRDTRPVNGQGRFDSLIAEFEAQEQRERAAR